MVRVLAQSVRCSSLNYRLRVQISLFTLLTPLSLSAHYKWLFCAMHYPWFPVIIRAEGGNKKRGKYFEAKFIIESKFCQNIVFPDSISGNCVMFREGVLLGRLRDRHNHLRSFRWLQIIAIFFSTELVRPQETQNKFL